MMKPQALLFALAAQATLAVTAASAAAVTPVACAAYISRCSPALSPPRIT